MKPDYDLDKIKFTIDRSTFEKAIVIYEIDGVQNFKDDGFGFSAKVRGSGGNHYQVYVSAKNYDRGNCNCYLGQNDTLCKHLVAVALYAILGGRKLNKQEKQILESPTCSGRKGELTAGGLKEFKAEISAAMRYIKPYTGPSRIWFAYQDSLIGGCRKLAKIISALPVSAQTAKLLVDLLLRLDNKLSRGGVDDSDGTVGTFIEETVQILEKCAAVDPSCTKAFRILQNKETCFDWEEPLLKLIEG